MSPFDDRAGVAEWQTSRVPIAVLPPAGSVSRAGGAIIVTAIASSMITACNFMLGIIRIIKVLST